MLGTPNNTRDDDAGGENSRDAYEQLLHESHGMDAQQRRLRRTWVSSMSPDRIGSLFELEMLLNGMICFANPRHHWGSAKVGSIAERDFRGSLRIISHGARRITTLARVCMPEVQRAGGLRRYLELAPTFDSPRLLDHDRPPAELIAAHLRSMRRAFRSVSEICENLQALPTVRFRLFWAVTCLAQQDVERSRLLTPSRALEFRPEFDQIQSEMLLSLVRSVRPTGAQHLVSLALLSLLRLRRLALLLRQVADDAQVGAPDAGRTNLLAAVIQSDARTLCDTIDRRGKETLADGFDREVGLTPASRVFARAPALEALGRRLIAIRETLECVSSNLRRELRWILSHAAADTAADAVALLGVEQLRGFSSELRVVCEEAVVYLARGLGARVEHEQVFEAHLSPRACSERVRVNVWVFAQIVRGFVKAARQTQMAGWGWHAAGTTRLVRDFYHYFRSMGAPLLSAGGYPKAAILADLVDRLAASDLLDTAALELAIHECDAYYAFLISLAEQIGRREELAGVAFDKAAAARMLRAYLGG